VGPSEKTASKQYGPDDGCKFGYVEVNGVLLENDKNKCYRKCGENGASRSRKPIKCECNFHLLSCEYKARIVRSKDWVNWNSLGTTDNPVIPNKCK